MSTLEVGAPAPPFDLESDDGSRVTLEGLRGRPVVLYFYPRDDTPGCTRQACSIRDSWEAVVEAGVALFGISKDSTASHAAFRQKYSLPFPLLADSEHEIAAAYGVWVEKRNYGRTYWGVERSAFVVAADGRLAAIRRRITPEATVEWALGAVAGLSTPA